jgi:glycosyltransferase involved in cell wall biosynthesis
MCRDIQQRGVLARYIVAGPDEGELPDVLAAIAQARTQGVDIDYLGALSNAAARQALAAADVYVLPSDDEPFPMTVLEAMAAGTPTVVTDTCGLAETIVRTGAGVVAARDVSDLADAVTKLLDDGSHWAAVSAAGRRVVDSELSADAVAQRLEEIYATACGDAHA